jgi:hypothetical protein
MTARNEKLNKKKMCHSKKEKWMTSSTAAGFSPFHAITNLIKPFHQQSHQQQSFVCLLI